MKKISETIVFYGSGPVAAQSLQLLSTDFSVEAVVTKPRAPQHTGTVPVLDTANQLEIPIFTAVNKSSLDDLVNSRSFKSKLAILIDFGIIVSQGVIDYFPLGIINSHFSLLPRWRGADPITFAILGGEQQTGVSLMQLVAAMDEGPLLSQAPYDLPPDITTPQLTSELITLSHSLIIKTLPLYINGQIKPYPQDKTITPTYSRRLTKADGLLNWQKTAEQLEREVRAFAGWPSTRTALGGKEVLVTKASVVKVTGKPGELVIRDKRLIVCTKHNALEIQRLKPAGKKEMTAQAFLAGYQKFL